MSNKIYRYYQPNDKDTKDNHSDCVIRALTKVLDKEWLTTFDDLLPYARDMQCMPSERKCYESCSCNFRRLLLRHMGFWRLLLVWILL